MQADRKTGSTCISLFAFVKSCEQVSIVTSSGFTVIGTHTRTLPSPLHMAMGRRFFAVLVSSKTFGVTDGHCEVQPEDFGLPAGTSSLTLVSCRVRSSHEVGIDDWRIEVLA